MQDEVRILGFGHTVVCLLVSQTRFAFRLAFDNSPYQYHISLRDKLQEMSMPIRANVLFTMFPYSIVLSEDLKIQVIGQALRKVAPTVQGRPNEHDLTNLGLILTVF